MHRGEHDVLFLFVSFSLFLIISYDGDRRQRAGLVRSLYGRRW